MHYQIPTSHLFLKRNTELRKAHIHSIIAKEPSPAPSAQNSTGCAVTFFLLYEYLYENTFKLEV